MAWAEALRAIGYYALYPVFLIGPPVLSLLGILISPLVHVVSFGFRLCLLPLRILTSLESLYIFLGVAGLVGASAGMVLHFSLLNTYRIFGLEPSSFEDHKPKRPRRVKPVRNENKSSDDYELPTSGRADNAAWTPSQLKREFLARGWDRDSPEG